MDIPKINNDNIFTIDEIKELKEAVKSYIIFLDTAEEEDEDLQENYERPIFEKAVELFYGKNIWDDFVNTKFQ